MGRFWGWVWACLLVVSFAAEAGAKEEEGFLPVHVCVRPPHVPRHVVIWSYWAYTTKQIYTLPADYATKRYKFPTYLYDPEAPPSNTKLLPPEEDRTLPCDPRPPPPEPPEPQKTTPKKEAPKQEGLGASGASGHDKKGEKKEQAQSPSPAPPAPSMRASEEEERRPRPPEHGVLSNQGVTKDWPHSVLPTREAEPKRLVLPTKRRDDACAWALPWPGQEAVDRAQVCRGKGEGNKPGVEKTWAEKAAESLAYTAGGVNLQFDEDLKRPDGKQFGVMGGRNPQGPNNPFMQAAASGVMIAAAVLSPKADKLFKRLTAGKKAAPLLMKEMEDVGHGVAEEIATKLSKRGDERLMRGFLADALQQNGAIGPYEVMQQFTDKLEGRWQAHHILEVQWANKFKLGNAAKMPSVILTEAEHKRFTSMLRAETAEVETKQELWEAYRKVYKDHPSWLSAIKQYLFNGK